MKTNYWTTKDGQQIAVEDLDDEHLLNILNMLKHNNPRTFFGMRISRINTSSYSVDKNREQLNLILGENKYISCAKQEIKDKFKGDSYHNPFQGEIASEQWDYHMLGGSDYDEIDDPYCFGIY
tara:strand:+ start:166 stop:534 length:369 start_codon:yes stop_codon:yes gene_type:complete